MKFFLKLSLSLILITNLFNNLNSMVPSRPFTEEDLKTRAADLRKVPITVTEKKTTSNTNLPNRPSTEALKTGKNNLKPAPTITAAPEKKAIPNEGSNTKAPTTEITGRRRAIEGSTYEHGDDEAEDDFIIIQPNQPFVDPTEEALAKQSKDIPPTTNIYDALGNRIAAANIEQPSQPIHGSNVPSYVSGFTEPIKSTSDKKQPTNEDIKNGLKGYVSTGASIEIEKDTQTSTSPHASNTTAVTAENDPSPQPEEPKATVRDLIAQREALDKNAKTKVVVPEETMATPKITTPPKAEPAPTQSPVENTENNDNTQNIADLILKKAEAHINAGMTKFNNENEASKPNAEENPKQISNITTSLPLPQINPAKEPSILEIPQIPEDESRTIATTTTSNSPEVTNNETPSVRPRILTLQEILEEKMARAARRAEQDRLRNNDKPIAITTDYTPDTAQAAIDQSPVPSSRQINSNSNNEDRLFYLYDRVNRANFQEKKEEENLMIQIEIARNKLERSNKKEQEVILSKLSDLIESAVKQTPEYRENYLKQKEREAALANDVYLQNINSEDEYDNVSRNTKPNSNYRNNSIINLQSSVNNAQIPNLEPSSSGLIPSPSSSNDNGAPNIQIHNQVPINKPSDNNIDNSAASNGTSNPPPAPAPIAKSNKNLLIGVGAGTILLIALTALSFQRLFEGIIKDQITSNTIDLHQFNNQQELLGLKALLDTKNYNQDSREQILENMVKIIWEKTPLTRKIKYLTNIGRKRITNLIKNLFTKNPTAIAAAAA